MIKLTILDVAGRERSGSPGTSVGADKSGAQLVSEVHATQLGGWLHMSHEDGARIAVSFKAIVAGWGDS